MNDDQFTKLSKQTRDLQEQTAARLDRVDGQALKLYQHTEERFNELHEEIQAVHSTVNRLYDAVDRILKHHETDNQERAASNHQLDRHEEWIERAAPQLNIKYDQAA
jgi:chromosome segregation ATPase